MTSPVSTTWTLQLRVLLIAKKHPMPSDIKENAMDGNEGVVIQHP